MNEIIAVAAGGAVGAILRYAVVNAANVVWGHHFPWGVLIANVAGSFALGLLGILFMSRFSVPDEIRLALLVGVLGAFTTFSAFSFDTLNLFEQGAIMKAAANVLANVFLCLLAVWGGAQLARQL
ncbi:MAG: fluoride efflux transporter CrcB [Pseudomonadota bacterium]